MGSHPNITADKHPRQSAHLNRRCEVVFHYDVSKPTAGTIVRDDAEAPFVTIIRLEDGRHVLGTECQYRPVVEDGSPAPDAPCRATDDGLHHFFAGGKRCAACGALVLKPVAVRR